MPLGVRGVASPLWVLRAVATHADHLCTQGVHDVVLEHGSQIPQFWQTCARWAQLSQSSHTGEQPSGSQIGEALTIEGTWLLLSFSEVVSFWSLRIRRRPIP